MAGKTVEVTDTNFESTILRSDKPAIVDFWAVWCGPCRIVAPILEELSEEYDGKAVIGKLDVDSNRDTAVKFGIQAIPTMLFFKDGQMVDRIVGAADRKTIQSKLDALL